MTRMWPSVGGATALVFAATLAGCARDRRLQPLPPADRAPPAEIRWDRWQVPHIYGESRTMVAHGLGWAQMRAYPAEVLQIFATARGEAAAILGRDALASDRLVRTLGIPRRAADDLAARTPEERAQLEAFAEGMNAFAADHPDAVPEQWRGVLPVRAEDPLARGEYGWLLFTLLAGQRPLLLTIDGTVTPTVAGSNAWAIAPSRSATGHALLLANPHLPWHGAWMRLFEAHLVGPDAPLYGVGFLGAPNLTIGFNDAIAWSLTVNVIDVADFYTVVSEGDGYRYDGKVVPFVVRQETIEVRRPDGGLDRVPLSIRHTVHGPVVDLADGQRVAVRTGLDSGKGEWLTQSWAMGRARNLDEFGRALDRLGMPMTNVVYADRDGHVLFTSTGRVPRRPQGDADAWRKPVPGDQSAWLWNEIHDPSELPRIVDPAGGFVQNSNSPPWLAAWPAALDPEAYRTLRIPDGPLSFREIEGLRSLLADDSIDVGELVQLQRNPRLGLAGHVLDDLVRAARADDDPAVRAAAELLAAWDGTTGSPGAVLFARWAQRWLAHAAFVEPWSATRPLETPRGIADSAVAVVDLDAAAKELTSHFGRLDPPWGEVHRLRDDLAGVGAPGQIGSFHNVEYRPDERGEMRPVAGDTFVAVVEVRPEGPRAGVVLTYGNTSPASPHAVDQLALYQTGTLREPLLERSAVVAGSVEQVTLTTAR